MLWKVEWIDSDWLAIHKNVAIIFYSYCDKEIFVTGWFLKTEITNGYYHINFMKYVKFLEIQ